MRLRPLLIATALALGTLMTTVHAQTAAPGGYAIPGDATLLSVAAQAEARRVPDVATISAGVVTQAADANAAMRDNATQMEKVMAAIRNAGVAERDIQTAGISVQPQYRYAECGTPESPPPSTGQHICRAAARAPAADSLEFPVEQQPGGARTWARGSGPTEGIRNAGGQAASRNPLLVHWTANGICGRSR